MLLNVVTIDELYDFATVDPNKGVEEIADICPSCGHKSLLSSTHSWSKDESDITIRKCNLCRYSKQYNGEKVKATDVGVNDVYD